jgi:hypothetical protein
VSFIKLDLPIRPRLGIDVDDVLADFISKHREVCQALYGRPEGTIIPCDWNFSNYKLTPEEHRRVWLKIQTTKDFWLRLGKKSGTESLKWIRPVDADMFFISSRVPSRGLPIEIQTIKWLVNNYEIDHPTVIIADGLDKGEIAHALRLDAFIDDRDKNCLQVKAALPSCRVFIKESGHNLDFENKAAGIERLPDFNAFHTAVLR